MSSSNLPFFWSGNIHYIRFEQLEACQSYEIEYKQHLMFIEICHMLWNRLRLDTLSHLILSPQLRYLKPNGVKYLALRFQGQ